MHGIIHALKTLDLILYKCYVISPLLLKYPLKYVQCNLFSNKEHDNAYKCFFYLAVSYTSKVIEKKISVRLCKMHS